MKLKLPASVKIKLPNNETVDVSAAQVIEHVVRTGRLLGACSEVDGVRTGARILAALASLEIADVDLAALKKQLASPSRGWVTVPIDLEAPRSGNEAPRVVRRHMVPSPLDVLPIVDALLAL